MRLTDTAAAPHDCGHRCCNERANPHHDHFLTPDQCSGCGVVSERGRVAGAARMSDYSNMDEARASTREAGRAMEAAAWAKMTDEQRAKIEAGPAHINPPPMLPVIHIAGPTIAIGPYRRCRCAWCGAVLEDVDLSMIAVAIPEGETSAPPLPEWPMFELIMVDGNMRCVVPSVEGERLPDGACGLLDPTVTL